jgi:1-acyl-sn-glycerol-3-phosphate acyltransferase
MTYGFVIIPRRQELVVGRAAAFRRLARLLQEGSPIGLTPEGAMTGATGRLVEPPEGSGLLIAHLSGADAPVLPVAAFEEGNALIVRFGEPFTLIPLERGPRKEQDRAARAAVMAAIGELLPREYHGDYAEVIASRRREE